MRAETSCIHCGLSPVLALGMDDDRFISPGGGGGRIQFPLHTRASSSPDLVGAAAFGLSAEEGRRRRLKPSEGTDLAATCSSPIDILIDTEGVRSPAPSQPPSSLEDDDSNIYSIYIYVATERPTDAACVPGGEETIPLTLRLIKHHSSHLAWLTTDDALHLYLGGPHNHPPPPPFSPPQGEQQQQHIHSPDFINSYISAPVRNYIEFSASTPHQLDDHTTENNNHHTNILTSPPSSANSLPLAHQEPFAANTVQGTNNTSTDSPPCPPEKQNVPGDPGGCGGGGGSKRWTLKDLLDGLSLLISPPKRGGANRSSSSTSTKGTDPSTQLTLTFCAEGRVVRLSKTLLNDLSKETAPVRDCGATTAIGDTTLNNRSSSGSSCESDFSDKISSYYLIGDEQTLSAIQTDSGPPIEDTIVNHSLIEPPVSPDRLCLDQSANNASSSDNSPPIRIHFKNMNGTRAQPSTPYEENSNRPDRLFKQQPGAADGVVVGSGSGSVANDEPNDEPNDEALSPKSSSVMESVIQSLAQFGPVTNTGSQRRKQKSNVENSALCKTRMCTQFKLGQCGRKSKDCKFAHSLKELRATSNVYKTKMCAFFQAGWCKAGAACRHAHGQAELRQPHEADNLPEFVNLVTGTPPPNRKQSDPIALSSPSPPPFTAISGPLNLLVASRPTTSPTSPSPSMLGEPKMVQKAVQKMSQKAGEKTGEKTGGKTGEKAGEKAGEESSTPAPLSSSSSAGLILSDDLATRVRRRRRRRRRSSIDTGGELSSSGVSECAVSLLTFDSARDNSTSRKAIDTDAVGSFVATSDLVESSESQTLESSQQTLAPQWHGQWQQGGSTYANAGPIDYFDPWSVIGLASGLPDNNLRTQDGLVVWGWPIDQSGRDGGENQTKVQTYNQTSTQSNNDGLDEIVWMRF